MVTQIKSGHTDLVDLAFKSKWLLLG